MFNQNLLLKIALIGTLASISNTALSKIKNPYYYGANAYASRLSSPHLPSSEEEETEGVKGTASLIAVYGRLGHQFHDNISAEMRVGTGLGYDTVSVYGYINSQGHDGFTDVNVSLSRFFGGYVRGSIPIGEYVSPYLVIGYTRGQVDVTSSRFAYGGSKSDFSYGIGTDIAFFRNWGANIEYMNYLDEDGVDISGYAVGIYAKF